MPPMTATKRTFLVEVLNVRPKKKGLLERGPGDARVQATKAFETYRTKEAATIKKIRELDPFTDADAVREKGAFENRVEAIQAEIARVNQGDAAAANAALTAKGDQLAAMQLEVEMSLTKAGLRKAYIAERAKAELLLTDLVQKNPPGVPFDGPLTAVLATARSRKGDETPDAPQQLAIESKRVHAAQVKKIGEYTTYKAELDKADALLTNLKTLNRPGLAFDAPLDAVIADAKNEAAQGNYADAARNLSAEAKATHKAQVAKTAQYATYLSSLASAEEYERKLVALNRSDYDDEFEEPMTDLIAAAKAKIVTAGANSAANEEIAEANQILSTARATYNTQVTAADKAKNAALESARWKPVYEDKLARIDEAMDQLRPLPGTKTALAELRGLKAKANDYEVREDYENAYKALSGLTKALRNGKEAAATFHETAGGTACAAPFKKAEAALTTCREICGLGRSAWIDARQLVLDSALKEIETQPDKTRIQALVGELTQLATDLRKEAADQKKYSEEAEAAYATANTMFGELKLKAPLAVWEAHRETFRAASALKSVQQYQQAKLDLEAVTAAMTQAHTDATGHFDKWEALLAERDLALPDLTKAQAVANIAVSGPANLVINTFKPLAIEVTRTHDYAMACTEGRKALDTLPGIRANLATYALVRANIKTARSEIGAKSAEVQAAFDAHPTCDLTDFQARLEQLDSEVRDKFDTIIATAREVDDFKARILAALGKIVTDLDAELLKPGEQVRREKTAETKTLQAEFNLAKNEASRAIDSLAEDDPAKAKVWKGKFDIIVARVAGPAGLKDEDLEAMTELQDGVAADAKDYLDQVEATQAAARNLAAQYEITLKALEKTNVKYKELFAALRDRISDCAGLYESSVLAVVKNGLTELEKVGTDITAVKDNNAKGSRSTENFAAVEAKIAEIKKSLGKNAALKTCLPSKLFVLEHRIDHEVPDDTKKVTPKAALTDVLVKFQADVDQAFEDARLAAEQRVELTRKGTELKASLNALADVPKLKASFTNRIDAAASPGEGGEPRADLELQAIAQLIAEAVSDPESRVRMETKANEDEFKAGVAAQEWEASSAVFEKNAKRKADAAYAATNPKDRNEALYQEIGDVYKEATKLAKLHNYPTAVQKLAQAAAAANRFVVNPLGGAATARSSLWKVDAEWQRAVATYVSNINAMSKAMIAENQQPPVADLAPITPELTRLTKLFDAQIFAPFIGVMVDADKPLEAKRTAKEQGLRFVREFRDALQDKVLQHLANGNPFVPAFSTNDLDAKLNQLELNLLRA